MRALFMIFLVVSMPICFAAELNLIYDANGNLVTGDGQYRVYNSLNQLWKVYNGSDTSGNLLQEYTYHPTEERVLVKKTYESGALAETVYYVDENYVRVVNSSGSSDYTYVKHEGQLVAQLEPDSSKVYTHDDHLGSSSVVTDENGNIIEKTTYSPFGEVMTGGRQSRYGYEGKEHDKSWGKVPTDDLVSYWSFEGNADDEVSQNDGTITGAIRQTGKVRDGYEFDGNDKIEVPDDPTLEFTASDSFTVCLWFRASTGEIANGADLIHRRIGSYGNGYHLAISGNDLRFGIEDINGVYPKVNSDALSDNTWYFGCGVRNVAADKLYVYIDGTLIRSTTDTTTADLNSSSDILYIGRGASYFNGTIDEAGIWSRALSSDEISNLYRYGARFDDRIGTTDFHFRQYKSEWGLFTQPDTLIQDVYDPQSLNRYMFERGNPYRYVDQEGHNPIAAIIGFGALMTYAWGDAVGYSILWLGTGYLKLKNKNPKVEKEIDEKLNDISINIMGAFSPASPKSWLTIVQDYKDVGNLADRVNTDYNQPTHPLEFSFDLSAEESSRDYGKTRLTSPARDSSGKTEWDKRIEENKRKSDSKRNQGLKFKGYDDNGRAVWE